MNCPCAECEAMRAAFGLDSNSPLAVMFLASHWKIEGGTCWPKQRHYNLFTGLGSELQLAQLKLRGEQSRMAAIIGRGQHEVASWVERWHKRAHVLNHDRNAALAAERGRRPGWKLSEKYRELHP